MGFRDIDFVFFVVFGFRRGILVVVLLFVEGLFVNGGRRRGF